MASLRLFIINYVCFYYLFLLIIYLSLLTFVVTICCAFSIAINFVWLYFSLGQSTPIFTFK